MEPTIYPSYIMDEFAQSPAPQPSLTPWDQRTTQYMSEEQVAPIQQVVMSETMPDIDMKIRESEFKMKGEIIQLRNKVLKLERDVGLCCPNYDKMATNIQSRFRGKKDRTEMTQKYPEVFNKVTKGWVVIKDAQDGIWNHSSANWGENGYNGIEIMKEKTDFGFWACPRHNNYTGGLVQNNKELEEILNVYIKKGSARSGAWVCDFHVAPGVSYDLIKQKMNEGFEIEFEDGDQLVLEWMSLMGGSSKRRKTRKIRNHTRKIRRKTRKIRRNTLKRTRKIRRKTRKNTRKIRRKTRKIRRKK